MLFRAEGTRRHNNNDKPAMTQTRIQNFAVFSTLFSPTGGATNSRIRPLGVRRGREAVSNEYESAKLHVDNAAVPYAAICDMGYNSMV